jgi:anti-sigma-K factor RskA
MTDNDIDGLAAEYVLGSLDPDERRAVDARCKVDRELGDALAAWEKRLAPLSDWVPGIEPPAHVLDRITGRLWGQGGDRDAYTAQYTAQVLQLAQLRQGKSRWRAIAIGVSAIAACLAVVVTSLVQHLPPSPTTLISVLQKSAFASTADENSEFRAAPAFLVTVDLKAHTILVNPVAARPTSKRSYQLWLTPLGSVAPTSLGVIAQSGSTTVAWKERFAVRDLMDATLAISLEPEGGAATAMPTGPILFVGKLFPGAL